LGNHNVTERADLVSVSKGSIEFQKAVLMCVGYIGELSKKVDDGIKQDNPGINWRRLEKSRNIIFHDYDIVSMEVIASVIFNDIKALLDILCGGR
jgi:uncharacterized protein with HEPN domain